MTATHNTKGAFEGAEGAICLNGSFKSSLSFVCVKLKSLVQPNKTKRRGHLAHLYFSTSSGSLGMLNLMEFGIDDHLELLVILPKSVKWEGIALCPVFYTRLEETYCQACTN